MTIDDVMPKICEAAAAAVEGYAKVTGEDAGEDVPESFIQFNRSYSISSARLE